MCYRYLLNAPRGSFVEVSAGIMNTHTSDSKQAALSGAKPDLPLSCLCSYLLNASRGSVVDLPALADALRSGHVAGAAVDVYPTEPEKNSGGFVTGWGRTACSVHYPAAAGGFCRHRAPNKLLSNCSGPCQPRLWIGCGEELHTSHAVCPI